MTTRLGRAKSASSLRPARSDARFFTLSAEAQQEAVTAAELAFERGQQRAFGNKDGKGVGRSSEAAAPDSDVDIQRKHSIRFTGPNALKPKKIDITRREAPEDHHTTYSEYRNANPYQRHDDNFASTLISQEQDAECVGPYLASEPSSYRKLRKAKSMFNLGKTPSVSALRVPASTGGHFKRHLMHTEDFEPDRSRRLHPRLRRSIPFLRGLNDGLHTNRRQQVLNDEAVQLARDHYLYDLDQQRLKKQPSFLKLSKRRKSHAQLHRRYCGESRIDQNDETPGVNMDRETIETRWIGQKARSASETLRKAVNKVFSRHSKLSILPVQHLDAEKAHYGNSLGDNDLVKRYTPIPSPDIHLLRRVASREVPGNDIHASQLSFIRRENLNSASGDGDISARQSRVSSWTDSTEADNAHLSHFVERKRLSIIREDAGPHQPSSSAERHMGAADSYAAFRHPIRLVDPCDPAPAQRVYSALQKEIRRSGQKLDLDSNEYISDDSFDQTSSLRHDANQRDERSDSIAKQSNKPGYQSPNSLSTRAIPVDTYTLKSYTAMNGHDQLTPQQVADINETDLPVSKGPLREIKSAFFPSDVRYDRMTPSPYRRAKNEPPLELHEPSRPDDGSPYLPPFKSTKKGDKRSAALSDSVYSRTSGGLSPLANDSFLSRMPSDGSEEAGTAIIITSKPSSAAKMSWQSRQERLGSDTSSRRWTKWMNSEVSSLDDSQPVISEPYNMSMASELTYERELAQEDQEYAEDNGANRDEDEFDTVRIVDESGTEKQPLDIINRGLDPQPFIGKSTLSAERKSSTSLDRAERPKTTKLAKLKENYPTSMRQPASFMSPISGDIENPSKAVNAVQSHRSFKVLVDSQSNGNSTTTTSSYSRQGPERAERIRRLRSKSSQSLRGQYNMSSSSGHNDKHSKRPISSLNMGTPDNHYANTLNQSPSSNPNQKLTNQILPQEEIEARRKETPTNEGSGGDPAFI